MVGHMKTTVEISDELHRQVRQVARERGESMRSLLEEALRRLLDDHARTPSRRSFRLTTFPGTGMAEGTTPQQALEIANIRGGSEETAE
jgi:hypothetical protein